MDNKTFIAVLASRDSIVKNNELARVFEALYTYDNENIEKGKESLLKQFHFVFCGGTFSRLVRGRDQIDHRITMSRKENRISLETLSDNKDLKKYTEKIYPINAETREELFGKNKDGTANITVLPNHINGRVTLISKLIVQRTCNIIWPFFSPTTEHWTRPENLALLRLCDLWNAKRLMNAESVRSWWKNEAQKDARIFRQELPLKLELYTPEKDTNKAATTTTEKLKNKNKSFIYYYKFPFDDIRKQAALDKNADDYYFKLKDKTVALIAPDSMKQKIVDFALHYEQELLRFNRILATENTGRMIELYCRNLRNKGIIKCLPGPRGGNIEIATEILFNRCNIVIFFVDPMNPHPHIDDIRVVFGSCMTEMKDNDVRILTSEVQARDWIEGVIQHNVAPDDSDRLVQKGGNIEISASNKSAVIFGNAINSEIKAGGTDYLEKKLNKQHSDILEKNDRF